MTRQLLFALASAVSGALLSPAMAADMPLKAPASYATWTGFYVGGEIGYGWGGHTVNYAPNDPAAANLLNGALGLPGQQPVVRSSGFDRNGAIGGFEAGYNWQIAPSWVVGIEADINSSGNAGKSGKASGASVLQGPAPPANTQTISAQQDTQWYGTVRARAGWLLTPDLLLFGTGGLAYARTSDSASYIDTGAASTVTQTLGGSSFICTANATCFSGNSSGIKTGWTAGAGAEWWFNRHWSAKLEYQFVDLGSDVVRATANAAAPGNAPSSFSAAFSRDEIHVVRIGANYRF